MPSQKIIQQFGNMAAAAATLGTLLFGIAPRAMAQNYACLFYFSKYGDTEFHPANISPTGDSWIMQGQNPPYGPGNGTPNFWGKPLWAAVHGDGTIKNNYRFYWNGDPNQPNADLLNWHADVISRAGVDFVVLDFTNGTADFTPNGPSYVSATKALCNQWQARLNAGLPTPKIVFFVYNEAGLAGVESNFFNNYRSDLFFNYQGKKLVLVAKPNDGLGQGDSGQPAVPTNGRFANYTARHCWGLDNSGSCWQFKVNSATPPPPFYYNGLPEQMTAPVSSQASYMTTDGVNPTGGAQGRQDGAYFTKYMNAAINTLPRFTFVHSWNEWEAGNFGTQQNPTFVDQWLTEYSSDIEPMAGGHGWQYYDLMAQKVGQLKGNFPVISGHTYRVVNQNSNLCLDNPGGSTTAGQQMGQYQQNELSPQNWTFNDLGNGYWQIINGRSNMALEDYGWSTTLGSAVSQWPWTGGVNQQWSLRPVGNGSWLVVNRYSGLCMAVNNASTANNAPITQWADNGTADHNWRFEDTNGLFPGCYYTLTNIAGNINLDNPGGSTAINTQIGVWPANGATAQNWLLVPHGDGTYSLTNQVAGLRLDDPYGSNQPNTIQQLYYANNATAQNWRIQRQSDGNYTLTNVAGGLCLDNPNGSSTPGTKVQLWPANNATAQRWRLTRQ